MKKSLAFSSLFATALCATATASSFSASGAGGAFVDYSSGTYQTVQANVAFSSTAAVANPVTSVTSVVLTGITHTWVGDLQIVLKDPAGTGYNLMCRPGFTTAGFGNSGDFLSPGQTITFVPSGGSAIPDGNPVNIGTGSYNQHFGFVPPWTNGNFGISNTNMASISGAAGNWSLTVYDWAAGDVGSIGGWTLNGTDSSGTGVAFCEPTAAGVMACQCGNPNGAGVGCGNTGSSGAGLASAGNPSLAADATDPGSVTLSATSMLSGSSCIFLQGDGEVVAGTTFGAGIRCAGGQLLRLYIKPIVAGAQTAPQAGDLSISNRSTQLGTSIAPGTTRYYQTYYRDPNLVNPGGGCPAIATFNISSGQKIVWL